MNAQQAYAAGYVPNGHYVVCDPMGRVVRITSFLTSFSAVIYRATSAGLVRAHF